MTAAAGPGASTLVDLHPSAPPTATEPTTELAASLGFRDPAAALAQLAAIRADLRTTPCGAASTKGRAAVTGGREAGAGNAAVALVARSAL